MQPAGGILLAVLLAPAAAAFPSIAVVVNGASFQPVVSPGSWVSILGIDLATTERAAEIVEARLPTSLAGVTVLIDNRRAAIAFVSPTQLNVLAPAGTRLGPVPVTVINAFGASAPFTVEVAPFTPAFFQNGRYAVATRADFSLILPTDPARPGDTITLWGTGFGPVTGRGTIPDPPLVRIGGFEADYLSGALAPGIPGVYLVVVRVPALAPSGDLSVTAEFPGAASPSNVFLTLRR